MINRRELLLDGVCLGLASFSIGTLGHLLTESAESVEAAEPVQAEDDYPVYFREEIVWVTESDVVGKFHLLTYPFHDGIKIAAVKDHPDDRPFQRTVDRFMTYQDLPTKMAEEAYFYHLSGVRQAYREVVQHFGGLYEAPIEAINEFIIENGLG